MSSALCATRCSRGRALPWSCSRSAGRGSRHAPRPVNLGLADATASVIARHPRPIARPTRNHQITSQQHVAGKQPYQRTRGHHERIRIDGFRTLALAPGAGAISSRTRIGRETRCSKSRFGQANRRETSRTGRCRANRNFIRTVSPAPDAVSPAGRRQAGAPRKPRSGTPDGFARTPG